MLWIKNFQNKWTNKKWYVKLYDYFVSNNNLWFVKHMWHLFDKPSLGTVFFPILTGPEISTHANHIEQSISFQLHVNVHKCLVTLLCCWCVWASMTKYKWQQRLDSQFWREATPRSMHLPSVSRASTGLGVYSYEVILQYLLKALPPDILTTEGRTAMYEWRGAPLTHHATSFFNEKLE